MCYNLDEKLQLNTQDGFTGNVTELTVMNIGLTAVSSTRDNTFEQRLSEIRNVHQALKLDQLHDCFILQLRCYCSFPNISNKM